MRISDWSSDVCSSDLMQVEADREIAPARRHLPRVGDVQRVLAAQILAVGGEEQAAAVHDAEPAEIAVMAGIEPDVAFGLVAVGENLQRPADGAERRATVDPHRAGVGVGDRDGGMRRCRPPRSGSAAWWEK